ncbi:MAG TPA: TonB-dependent receptor [Bacteroidales bacterium]
MRFKITVLLCILTLSVNGQSNYTISGVVKDSLTGEVMIGAYISITDGHTGCVTNAYGFYSLTLPKGSYTIRYEYLGYLPVNKAIQLNSDVRTDVELYPKSISLKDVVVSGEASNHNVTSSEMSTQKLNIKEIKSLPVLFGEQDILKTIQLLPGVKSAGEGNSGFYVRGGTTDQNLIMLDEAPVYNTSHLLGFFSIFNSDAMKDVTVIKGGIPAEYGGRLSSVVDVRMNDGNMKNYGVSGGIGLISSRLTVQGPIVKDKGSFIISGRRTYADLFLKLSSDSNQRRTSLYFYDLNMKANYNLGNKDHVFLSGYLGRDVFNFAQRFGINWGNKTATLRWNHLFSDKLFLNSSLIFSDYSYDITLQGANRNVQISSGIRDFMWKEDFQYFISPHNSLKFGLNSTYHKFFPGSLIATGDTSVNSRILQSKQAVESGVYFSDEIDLTPKLKMNYGLRVSSFSVLGPGTFYYYDSEGDITDSAVYKRSSVVKTYYGFEPRLSFTRLLTQSSSIKASYTRIYQYVHLLSNTTSGNPTDLWLPTSHIIKPQYADQWALGYFRNFANNNFETSVEVYYKPMYNLIDYKKEADIVLNPNMESQLVFGKGLAYGAEFFIKKKEGKFTGWISYTLSRTLRQFSEINNGKSFPAKQDRIHDIALVGMYHASERWELASTWVFNTGDAVTFPSGVYAIEGRYVPLYTDRNGYRMPDYHRLDFSATNTKKLKGTHERSWNFSIYNVYARKNAYAINFQPDPNNPKKTQAVRLSLFSIIPSVTYNFKF